MYDRTIMRTCDRLQCLKTFLRPLGKPRICVEVDEQVAMGGDLLRRAFGACGALPHVALVPEIVTDRHDEGSAMEFKGFNLITWLKEVGVLLDAIARYGILAVNDAHGTLV